MLSILEKLIQRLDARNAVLIIVVVGSLVYINILANGFVWDDEEQIVNNTIIQNLSNLPQILSGATFSTGGAGLSGVFFRPLLTFSYMLSFAVFGQNAWGYHLLQILLHISNAVLLFFILQQLNRREGKKSLFVNLLASLTFVAHPITVEAVAYIGSSHYVWMTLLNLSAFLILIRSQNEPRATPVKKYVIVSLLLLSGMLFSELSVTAFPILVLYLILRRGSEWKKWIVWLGGILGLYFFLRLILARVPFGHLTYAPISNAPLIQRLLTVPKELFSYFHIFFWPDRLAIAQHFVVTSPTSPDFYLYLIIEALALAGVFFCAWRSKSPFIFFGLSWFLVGFAAVSNIFPLDMTLAERWMYFPFIGLLLVLVGGMHVAARRTSGTFWILAIFLTVSLVPLGVRTIVRNENWHDGLTLFAHDVSISQNSFDLENNLGVELFRSGRLEESKMHFEKSIALQSAWYFPWNNLGAAYERQGNWQKAAQLYQESLSRGDYYLAYENLAGIKLNHGTPQDAKQFIADGLKKLPHNARLWLLLALADYKLNLKDDATSAASNAFQLAPSDQTYYLYTQLKTGGNLQLP